MVDEPRRTCWKKWGCDGLLLCLLLMSLISCSDRSDENGGDGPDEIHILLITLDTTRQDALGVYGRRGGGESTTPQLDSIARAGHVFRQAFASTPLTLPSHATILTGLEPPQHGVRENNDFQLVGSKQRSFTTLAEDLSKAGFRNAAFVSSRVLARSFGLGAGFEVYDGVEENSSTGQSHYQERDAVGTTTAALRWMDAMEDKRSFMWVHYFDPHHPHVSHPGRAGLVAKATGSLYDGEVAFVDGQIGRLIQAYKERGIWDKTLVVVVGDHGEGMGEHEEESHGFLLHDATMRVPFIVKPPSGTEVHSGRFLARTIDIKPTVLAVAGVDSSAASVSGKSLFEPLPEGSLAYGETVYPYRQFGWAALYSVRQSDWLLIEGGGRSLLYDHSRDPKELKNVADQFPEKRKALSLSLLGERQKLESLIKVDSRRDVDGMRATAYIGGPSPDVPEEPTVDLNRSLAHPRDRMGRLRQLNRLIAQLETLQNTQDELKGNQSFLDAQMSVQLLREKKELGPSLRFWLGRAAWKLGTSPQGQATGKQFQQEVLNQGIKDLTIYLRDRPLDYRAWNMRLSIHLALFAVTKEPSHLDKMMVLGKEQVGRGLDDALMHSLLGKSHLARGEREAAIRSFETAVKKAPENRSFGRDLKLARGRSK